MTNTKTMGKLNMLTESELLEFKEADHQDDLQMDTTFFTAHSTLSKLPISSSIWVLSHDQP